MNTPKDIFRGQSRRALLIGWAALFIPFILCFLVQIPEISKIEAPLVLPYLQSGLFAGGVGSALFLMLNLLPLYYLRWTRQDSMAAYIRTPALWVALIALLLGLAAMVFVIFAGNGVWWQSLLSTMVSAFFLLIVPVLLVFITYWFMAIRVEGGMRAITLFSVLLVLWTIFCFMVASNRAALMAG